jgi:hypothetical protein
VPAEATQNVQLRDALLHGLLVLNCHNLHGNLGGVAVFDSLGSDEGEEACRGGDGRARTGGKGAGK